MGNNSLGHSMPLAQFTVISIRPSGENRQTTLLIEVDTEIRYLESLGGCGYIWMSIHISSLCQQPKLMVIEQASLPRVRRYEVRL